MSGGEGSRPALVLTMNDVPRSWAGGRWVGEWGLFTQEMRGLNEASSEDSGDIHAIRGETDIFRHIH